MLALLKYISYTAQVLAKSSKMIPGLDRYLRILASLFLKQQLVSVVFDVQANISAKAAPVTSDTTELEKTTAEQGEEEEEAEEPAAIKRPKSVQKRMKVRKPKPTTSASDASEGINRNQGDVRLEDKLRSLKRTEKERKASKEKVKRSKAGT